MRAHEVVRPRARRPRPLALDERFPDPTPAPATSSCGRARDLAQLPRRLHPARDARHQDSHARHHGPRPRRRGGEIGPGVEGWADRRPRARRSHRPHAGRADGRDDPRRPCRALPRAARTSSSAFPDGVSFVDAAALPVAYGTAHRMMVDAGTGCRRRARPPPRRQRRRRHLLRVSRQDGRRHRGGVRQQRGQDRAPARAGRRRRDRLRARRLHGRGPSPLRQAAAPHAPRVAWTW